MIQRRSATTAAAMWLVLLITDVTSSPSSAAAVMAFASSGGRRGGFDNRSSSNISRKKISNHHERIIHPLHYAHQSMQLKKRPRIELSLAATVSSSSSSSTAEECTTDASTNQLPLSQILQLLNERNVRYSPDATRSQLERLLLLHNNTNNKSQSTSHSKTTTKSEAQASERGNNAPNKRVNNQSKTSNNNNNVVVDAVVLDEQQQTPQQKSGAHHEQRRSEARPTRGRRRRQPSSPTRSQPPQEQQRRRQQQQQQSRGRTDARQGDWDQEAQRRRQSYDQQQYYDHHQRRRQQPNSNHGRRVDAQEEEDDIIDPNDFNLSESDLRDDEDVYDNGMQIFLMGFLEAGKAATQLAVDAVNPFSGNKNDNGEWWYDEERERNVLDVDILDYSPRRQQPEGRRRQDVGGRRRQGGQQSARREQPRGRGGGRQQAMYGANPPRRRDGRDDRRASAYDQANAVPTGRRRSTADDAGPTKGREESYNMTNSREYESTASVVASPQDKTTRRRSRRVDDEEGNSRPIYGLYHSDTIRDKPKTDRETRHASSRREEQAEYNRKQQQWKDRLRHKFDAALGLQSPSSSDDDTTYYDSWKTHMEDMDDGRKDALRRRHDAMSDSAADAAADDDDDADSKPSQISSYPKKNRRARMRASKSNVNKKRPPRPPSLHNNNSSKKSRLEEVPFWREGGTIASLLFDTRPSFSSSSSGGVRDGRRRMRSKSLQQLLLSPFGRHHTVTSLFLYISRSTLTSLAILCRWAGVRGTIPQPIVVTTVFAMLVSSRGQRVMSLAFTVLALRLVGEFIHGSLNGNNEFWDDECDWKEDDTRYRSY